jgi:hypothetical protein
MKAGELAVLKSALSESHPLRLMQRVPRYPNVGHMDERPLDLQSEKAHKVVMTTTFDPAIGITTRRKRGQPSPNPGGRPKSRLLSQALGSRLAQIKPDDPEGRTYAAVVAANLIDIACSRGPGAVTAANEIADRLEGRPTQQLDIKDVGSDLRSRSDEELAFHLRHDRWPDEDELSMPGSTAGALE